MANKLAGDAYVYWEGSAYAPGDELPDELVKLSPSLVEASDEPASPAGGGAGAVDPEFDSEKATVPQLRDELKRLGVEFDSDDRKDALQIKYREAVGE